MKLEQSLNTTHTPLLLGPVKCSIGTVISNQDGPFRLQGSDTCNQSTFPKRLSCTCLSKRCHIHVVLLLTHNGSIYEFWIWQQCESDRYPVETRLHVLIFFFPPGLAKCRGSSPITLDSNAQREASWQLSDHRGLNQPGTLWLPCGACRLGAVEYF